MSNSNILSQKIKEAQEEAVRYYENIPQEYLEYSSQLIEKLKLTNQNIELDHLSRVLGLTLDFIVTGTSLTFYVSFDEHENKIKVRGKKYEHSPLIRIEECSFGNYTLSHFENIDTIVSEINEWVNYELY